MEIKSQSKNLNKLIIVAALGYFVDIYDLLLFGVERTESLNTILPIQYPGISDSVLKTLNASFGKLLLNWQMAGMLFGGIFWGILGDKRGRLSVFSPPPVRSSCPAGAPATPRAKAGLLAPGRRRSRWRDRGRFRRWRVRPRSRRALSRGGARHSS